MSKYKTSKSLGLVTTYADPPDSTEFRLSSLESRISQVEKLLNDVLIQLSIPSLPSCICRIV